MPDEAPFDWVKIALDEHLTDFDEEAAEAVLATALANKLEGNAVWLILIAPPSSGKTFILQPLEGIWDCEVMSTITPRTFLSGAVTNQGGDPSLLTRLGKRPFVVVKDLGTILETNHKDRAELFSQLREVYDGFIAKEFGTGVKRSWSGKMTLIVAMTGAIDKYTSLAAELGERFLRLRLSVPSDPVRLAKKAVNIAGHEDRIQSELHDYYRQALMEGREKLSDVVISDESKDRIANLAAIAAHARTTVETSLRPEPESTPRLMKQLLYVAQGQCALRAWRDVEDWSLLKRIALDVIPEPRRSILKEVGRRVVKEGSVTNDDLTVMSSSTRYRVLKELARLGLLNREQGVNMDRGQAPIEYEFTETFDQWRRDASLLFT